MSFYEIIEDITADAGVRVKAKTLEELIYKAILATFNEITDIEKVQKKESHTVEVYSNLPYMLADAINQAIVLHESKGFVASSCEVLELSENYVKLKLFGDKFDDKKNEPKLVIKAATYHRLKVEKLPDGYLAEVIFDI